MLATCLTMSIALEILMWGGDEALFIVPGWRFLDALSVLSESLPKLSVMDGEALTCAVGAVICDRKTPIRRVKDLLGNLVTEFKRASHEGGLLHVYLGGMYELPVGNLEVRRGRLFGLDRAPANRALSLPMSRIGSAKLGASVRGAHPPMRHADARAVAQLKWAVRRFIAYQVYLGEQLMMVRITRRCALRSFQDCLRLFLLKTTWTPAAKGGLAGQLQEIGRAHV